MDGKFSFIPGLPQWEFLQLMEPSRLVSGCFLWDLEKLDFSSINCGAGSSESPFNVVLRDQWCDLAL